MNRWKASGVGMVGGVWLSAALLCGPLGTVLSADEQAKAEPAARAFVEIADKAGVRYRHYKCVLDPKLDCIMPWMASVGASVAAADYDNDGDIDIYAVSSMLDKPNALFRNNGDMTFTDVAAEAGLDGPNHQPVLFSISTKSQENLDKGVLSEALRQELLKHGKVTLNGHDEKVTILEPGRLWRVTCVGFAYTVKKGDGALDVCENRGTCMDAVWGDYDNDGHMDLYIIKWGPNILYHANGDGTFTDVTEKTGVGDRGNGNAGIWFDYDVDGDLDLYIGNYFRYEHLWALESSRTMHEDFETARDAGANVLYRNNGDGTFTDVTKEMGVGDTGWTLDSGAGDYDNDGDQDLANANDFGQDRFYRVNADGTFTNVTDEAIGWDTYKGMNIEFGDFNNDGWLDLYVANIWTKEYVKEGNQLYRNMGDKTFNDISFEAEVYDGGWCWAGKFWDYDNDGDLDIMVANGYISGTPDDEYFTKLATSVTQSGFDPIDAQNWPTMGDSTFSGYQTSRVWRNEGNEVFKQVAEEIGLADIHDGRGLAIADFDNDGDLDVYISNQGQESSFYRNDIGNKNNWLQLELTGTNCNRNAIGTRVTLVAEGQTMIREVYGGNGGHCQCPFRLHFGIGQRKTIESMEIRWPTGYVERFENVKPNQILKFTENTPKKVLEERKIIKEAEIAALMKEREREKAEAQSAKEPDLPPQDWTDMVKYKKQFLQFIKEIEKKPDDPKLRYDFAMLLDKQDRKRAALSELERAIRQDPNALLYSNTYRTLIRRYGSAYYDQSIRFFEDLADKHPKAIMPRLNKSLSYVDKMPYPKLGIVSQGQLSNKSLAVLDTILADDPRCWTAKFIRGMNHLHWPRKLNHAPLAIKDFTELIELQKKLPPEKQRDYFALGYVGLGDSYVKNREEGFEENLAKAREAWQQGLKEYPDREELKVRLELWDKSEDKAELIEFIRSLRGLEDPVDTDLANVWVD
ncbi:MAG: VCBS repeat-containing protein [Phycisphaerae bacterium]|nr:VCBS repeat-containing protein [Phycisphaerae bacterium]